MEETEMRPYRCLLSLLALLTSLGLCGGLAQTDHITAFTGTWKLNLSKSKFNPGPPFKSFTLAFTPDGVRHLDLVGADGQSLNVALPWSDGLEVTPTGQGMEDTKVISKIQGKTVEDTWRRNGTVIEKVHGSISSDGKTLTMNVEGPRLPADTFRNRVVFDKQ